MTRYTITKTDFAMFIVISVAYAAWTVLRSVWLDQGRVGMESLDVARIFVMVFALGIPIAFVARHPQAGLWLFGATATYMVFPSVPRLPFITAIGHMVIWTIIMGVAYSFVFQRGDGSRWRPVFSRPDLFVLLVGLFWFEGAVALAIRMLDDGGVWEAKVGASELIRYLSFVIMAHLLALNDGPLRNVLQGMEKGAKIGIVVAIVFGYVGIVAIFSSDIQPTNDTALGFGYWGRLKSTFSGPDSAGIYYAAVISFVFFFASRLEVAGTLRQKLIYAGLLVSLVFLVMATGSRAARLAALIPLMVGLAYRPYRSLALVTLPFVAFVYYLGFYFRSLPEAVSVFLTGDSHVGGMSQNFWQDAARIQLVRDTLEIWLSQPFAVVLGFGPGLAGYSASSYPSPHLTILDIAVEQGLAGTAILATAVLVIIVRLVKSFLQRDGEHRDLSLSVLVTLAVLGAGGLTYDLHTWSFVWYFVLLGLVVGRSTGCVSRAADSIARQPLIGR